jgi:transcriptional regulator with XRE-family HTH domain
MPDLQTTLEPGPITAGLTAHIRRGFALRRLARRSGVDRSVLQRFLRGERNISVRTADRLAAHLGLMLIVRPADPPSVSAPVEQ